MTGKCCSQNDINILDNVEPQTKKAEIKSKVMNVNLYNSKISINVGRVCPITYTNVNVIKPPVPPKPAHVSIHYRKFVVKHKIVSKTPLRASIVVTKSSLPTKNNPQNGKNIRFPRKHSEFSSVLREKPCSTSRQRILFNKLDDAFKALSISVADQLKDDSTSDEEPNEVVDFESHWLDALEKEAVEKKLSSDLFDSSSENSCTNEELLSGNFCNGDNLLYGNKIDFDDTSSSSESNFGLPTDSIECSENIDKKSLTVKAFNVAQEMLTSERSYYANLKMLNETFKNYLIENGAVIKGKPDRKRDSNSSSIAENTLDHILFTLPNLQNLSETILDEFANRIQQWENEPKIASVIVKNAPYLKIYVTYIKNLQKQTNLLEKCAERHSLFGQSLKEFENLEACKKIPISKHMLVPLQRVVKYKELIKQYLKYVPEDAEDHSDAVEALEIVLNVAEHSNNAIKQLDNTARLLSLQDRLNGMSVSDETQHFSPGTLSYVLVEPGRSLVKDGPLLKLNRSSTKNIYLILLSDVLLYTSVIQSNVKSSPLKLNEKLPLEGMRVEIQKADEFKNEFSVISTTRSFALRTRSAKERNDWITSLVEAIDANAKRRSSLQLPKTAKYEMNDAALGKQAPVWVPDNRVTMCQSCTAEFTFTFRRHHCRACGKVVCHLCSSYRAPLQYLEYETARVCLTCFNILQKDFESIEDSSQEQMNDMHLLAKLKSRFKRGIKDGSQHKGKSRPDRLLEVCASDMESQMAGYLTYLSGKNWNHSWFVLKDKVLYEYRAPHDVCALQSLPVLGYEVQTDFLKIEYCEGRDKNKCFLLCHSNQPPLIFLAECTDLADKWRKVMEEAVVL